MEQEPLKQKQTDFAGNPLNPSGIAGKPLNPTVNANGNAYETYMAANAIPEPTAPKPDVSEKIKELHNEGPVPTLRTYQSDIADAVKEQQTSIVRIAVAEKKKREAEGQADIGNPSISAYTLGLSGLLILGGLIVFLVFFFVLTNREVKTPPIKIDKSQIIATEITRTVPVANPSSILNLFKQQQAISETPGSVVRLNFTASSTDEQGKVTSKIIDSQTFAAAIGAHMPSWLARSLNPEYVAGLYMHNGAQPFVIFRASSRENSLAGMLKWEEFMKSDLAEIIPPQVIPQPVTPVATTTATTSSRTRRAVRPTPAPVVQPPADPIAFEDVIINNKDVRVLKNAYGAPVLMYSLPDKETIVVVTSSETLREIFARLTTSQFVR